MRLVALAGLAVSLMLPSVSLLAQAPDNGGNRGNRGGPPGGGRGSPEEMRKRMMDRLRELMEVKEDAEWGAISPLIEKVMELNRETRWSSMGVLFTPPGGENRDGGNRTSRFGGSTPPEVDALRKAIEGKAGEGDVKSSLERLRDARTNKDKQIEEAQAKLRLVLTPRQEAVCVLVGLLK